MFVITALYSDARRDLLEANLFMITALYVDARRDLLEANLLITWSPSDGSEDKLVDWVTRPHACYFCCL